MAGTQPTACATCTKTIGTNDKPLLRCSGCKSISYCNKDCQKADWKTHKKTCSFQPKPKPSSPFSSADSIKSMLGINFTTKYALEQKPNDEDVYKVLIDSFRMRVEDEYKFRGDIMEDSAYGNGDPAKGFRRYLLKAEKKENVLPGWWNAEKREACVRFGLRTDHWWQLDCAVEKGDIQEEYGDNGMPMQLRIVAEEIVGSNVMGPGAGLE